MAKSYHDTISWSNHETDSTYDVEFTLSGGSSGQMWGEGAHPPESPELEVGHVELTDGDAPVTEALCIQIQEDDRFYQSALDFASAAGEDAHD